MNFYVMTLFPEMIENGLHTSITGRAIRQGAIGLKAVDIRDYSTDKYRHVDDYPYGGGAGMVMQPGPIFDCYTDLTRDMLKKPRVIYTTPRERCLTRKSLRNWRGKNPLSFCADTMKGWTSVFLMRSSRIICHRGLCPHRRRVAGHGHDRRHFPSCAWGVKQ